MKIAYTGLELPEGKVKYNDATLADLEGMFDPDKVTPFYFELLPDNYETAEGIAITAERLLDLLILDMEKTEGRLSLAEKEAEKAVLAKCLKQLFPLIFAHVLILGPRVGNHSSASIAQYRFIANEFLRLSRGVIKHPGQQLVRVDDLPIFLLSPLPIPKVVTLNASLSPIDRF